MNRELLEQQLDIHINKYSKNRAVKKLITQDFNNRGLLSGDVNDIMTLRLPLNTLSDVMLLVFSNAMYKATRERSINPISYCTSSELEIGLKYKVINQELPKFPIVFDQVIQLDNDQWVTYISAQQLKDLYDRKAIIYNLMMQKSIKQLDHHEINKIPVREIENSILSGHYIPNFIMLNLLHNDKDNFTYDKNTLTINSGDLHVLDLNGLQTCIAIIHALADKDISMKLGIMLTNFDVDKAKRFIIQERIQKQFRFTQAV